MSPPGDGGAGPDGPPDDSVDERAVGPGSSGESGTPDGDQPGGDASAGESGADGPNAGRPSPTGERRAGGSRTDGTETEVGTADRTGARPRQSETGGGSAVDWQLFAYDVLSSAVAVFLVGVFVLAVSGVYPPMVAIESPSMTPNMKTGDLVFVMDEKRFPGEGEQGDTGVVTARAGRTSDVDYPKFKRQGDVIVYKPAGDGDRTPIIHRAMFWVNESENWYDKADRQAVGGAVRCGNTTSEGMENCPAPHAGFITLGDANGVYDQVRGLSGPVKPEWVVGTAELRIPKLGCLRLRTRGCGVGLAGVAGPVGGVEALAECQCNATARP